MKDSSYTKGLTLIEIIVTLAILAIFTTAIYTMFNFQNKIFFASSSQYSAQSAARLRVDSICNDLSNATIVEIYVGEINFAAAQVGYNYFVIKTDNTIHSYVYDVSTGFKDLTYSGFSSATSYFSKVDGTTLKVHLVGQDKSKTFITDTSVYMKNFPLMSPISSIPGNVGVAGKTVRYKLTH